MQFLFPSCLPSLPVMINNSLSGNRTYITLALLVLYAISAWATGNMDANTAVTTVMGAIAAVFGRAAIANSAPPAPPTEQQSRSTFTAI